MKFFQFLVATEAFMPKPGNKQFTMDNIDYNPQRDGKQRIHRTEFAGPSCRTESPRIRLLRNEEIFSTRVDAINEFHWMG